MDRIGFASSQIEKRSDAEMAVPIQNPRGTGLPTVATRWLKKLQHEKSILRHQKSYVSEVHLLRLSMVFLLVGHARESIEIQSDAYMNVT